MKEFVQGLIRSFHRAFLDGGLPSAIGIYLHDIPREDWDPFRGLVGYFRRRGYDLVDPDRLCREGAGKRLFLSFDDNFLDWYAALPLFDELDVRVTFYVNTLPMRDTATEEEIDCYYDRVQPAGARTPLSRRELTALAAAGHTVGSHTHSHAKLTCLREPDAREDIRRGKEVLGEILGRETRHFSYPFGMRRHFSPSLLSYCRDIGFDTVAKAIPAVQHRGHSPSGINRSPWSLRKPLSFNVGNVRIDGRVFERLTGRSPVG